MTRERGVVAVAVVSLTTATLLTQSPSERRLRGPMS